MNNNPPNPPLSQHDIENGAQQPPHQGYPNQYAPNPQPYAPQNQPYAVPPTPQGQPPQPYYLQQAQPPQSAAPAKVPKGQFPLLILGAIIVLALVIGGAAFFYLANSNKKAPQVVDQKDEKPKTNEKPEQTSAIDTVAYLRNYFKGEGHAKTSLSTPVKSGEKAFYTVATDPKLVETTSISESMPFENIVENMVSIRRAFEFYGYKELVLNENQDNVNFLADYTRPEVHCQLYAEKPADQNSPHYLEVKCLDTSEYDKLASEQEPFYRAYTEASASGVPIVLLGKAEVVDSASAGYRLAEIKTGSLVEGHLSEAGPNVKYYSGTDGIWRYFTNSNDVMPCATYYKSPSLTAAYLNTPCMNSKNQQVTVTLKRNNG